MMGRCALLLVLGVLCALGCGGESPPAFIPPGVDASDEDAEAGSGGDAALEDSGVDGGGTGGSGGGLTGDLCSMHLGGISCQVKQIAAGRSFSCALFEDGRVKCWGRWGGLIGDSSDEMGENLGFLDFGAAVEEIVGGADELAARTADGRVFSAYGDLEAVDVRPIAIPGDDPAVALGGPSCAVLASGLLRCWTWGRYGPLDGYSLDSPVAVPINRDLSSAHRVNQATLGLSTRWIAGEMRNIFNTCVVSAEGDAQCWGNGAAGNLGPGDTFEPSTSLPLLPFGAPVKDVVPGPEHTCAIMEADDSLRCFGKNNFGQLGQNGTNSAGGVQGELEALEPVDIGAVAQVALGGVFTCARTVGGPSFCWGGGIYGQTGRGDRNSFGIRPDDFPNGLIELDLGTERRALQIVAGEGHACALLDDHSVKCWGQASIGALGLGDLANRGDDPNEMGDQLPRVNLGAQTSEGFPPDVSVVSPPEPVGVEDISTADTLTVTCDAVPSETDDTPVDPANLAVRLFAENNLEVRSVTAALVSGSQYRGTLINLSSLPTGRYLARCEASTLSDPARTGSASVYILHDGGPSIEVVRPLEGEVVAQRVPTVFEVDVSAAELVMDDTGAAVTDVEFSVAGQVFAAVLTSTPGRYRATIDPRSSVFTNPLAGPTLFTVRAANARGVTATMETQVVIDAAGPTVVIGPKHDNGRLVRGVQEMDITVTDALAGVDSTAGFGRIGSYTFPLTLEAGTKYRGVFDTLRFDRTVSQLTIEIHAFDLVGNETIVTRSIQLDNQPPILSLDPPDVREFKNGVTPGAYFCSVPFDPVGSDSISDGDVAPAGAEFRVRVEDETNGLQGQGVLTYLALVDPAQVRIYMQSDQTAPILIDTNGDGTCDEVNDRVAPHLRNLVPITPAGKSHYSASAATDGLDPTWPSWCDAGAETAAPALLCAATSPLTRVIKAGVLGQTVPAIYGLAPANTVSCVGDSWDWRSQFPLGGPVCVVARAEDTLGNVGVSVPLRVCLQATGPGAFDCAANLSWQNHDCLAGTYGGASVTCDPPPDYPFDFVREDSPR